MNKGKYRVLSLVSIAVIAISIPVTLAILKASNLDIRISAFESDAPVKLIISDVRDTSLRVSWVTEKEVLGGLKVLPETNAPLLDDKASSYHSLEILNLQPGKTYQFVLLSDGKIYNNNGANYQAKTAISSVAPDAGNYLIYGQVFSKDGQTFQQGGVILLQLNSGANRSQQIVSTINESGGYQFNLKGLRSEDLSKAFAYKTSVDITATIFTAKDSAAVVKKYTVDLQAIRQMPSIYLGDISIDVIPGVVGN